MEFRWVALIALWTLLVGPVFDSAPTGFTRAPRIHVVTPTPARP